MEPRRQPRLQPRPESRLKRPRPESRSAPRAANACKPRSAGRSIAWLARLPWLARLKSLVDSGLRAPRGCWESVKGGVCGFVDAVAGQWEGQPSRPSIPGTSSAIRIPELDGLRGIAILLAMGFFLVGRPMWEAVKQSGGPTGGLSEGVMRTALTGWLGLELFFVLSGFLITGMLLDRKRAPNYFRNFYARRGLRIVPVYAVALAVAGLLYSGSVMPVLLGLGFSANLAPIVAAFSGATLPADPFGGALIVLATLAIVVQFYCIWPLVIRYLRRPAVIGVAASIVVLVPLVRAAGFGLGVDDVSFYPWFRFDGFASGALVALFARSRSFERALAIPVSLIAVLTALLIALIIEPHGILVSHHAAAAALRYTIGNLLWGGVILFAITMADSPFTAWLRSRPLVEAGHLSYALFAAHLFLFDFFNWSFASSELKASAAGSDEAGVVFVLLRAAIVSSLAFFAAYLSRQCMENPAAALKGRFLPKKRIPRPRPVRKAGNGVTIDLSPSVTRRGGERVWKAPGRGARERETAAAPSPPTTIDLSPSIAWRFNRSEQAGNAAAPNPVSEDAKPDPGQSNKTFGDPVGPQSRQQSKLRKLIELCPGIAWSPNPEEFWNESRPCRTQPFRTSDYPSAVLPPRDSSLGAAPVRRAASRGRTYARFSGV